jgi:hypothetical protein
MEGSYQHLRYKVRVEIIACYSNRDFRHKLSDLCESLGISA